MHDMTCPRCAKLLGKTSDPIVVDSLLLWCRRCKREVKPQGARMAVTTESHASQESPKE